MSNTIFVVAMNQAKYDSLPPDLKKVIDANSGLDDVEVDRQGLRQHDRAGEQARARAQQHVFNVLSPAEYERWKKATEGVDKEWITEVAAKGGNGPALLDDAKALLKKNGG